MGDIGVGEGHPALQDPDQLVVHLQLPLGEGVVGVVAGRDLVGGQPVAVDRCVEVVCLRESAQLVDVFHDIGAEPGVGTRLLIRIRIVVGEGEEFGGEACVFPVRAGLACACTLSACAGRSGAGSALAGFGGVRDLPDFRDQPAAAGDGCGGQHEGKQESEQFFVLMVIFVGERNHTLHSSYAL